MGLTYDHSFRLFFVNPSDTAKLWDYVLGLHNYIENADASDEMYRHSIRLGQFKTYYVQNDGESVLFSSGGYGFQFPVFAYYCHSCNVMPGYVLISHEDCQSGSDPIAELWRVNDLDIFDPSLIKGEAEFHDPDCVFECDDWFTGDDCDDYPLNSLGIEGERLVHSSDTRLFGELGKPSDLIGAMSNEAKRLCRHS